MSPAEPTRDFIDAVHAALQLWHKEPGAGSPLGGLLLVQRQLATGANVRRATNEVLLAGLKALAVEREADATLLQARFLDARPVFLVANERNLAEVTIYKLQRRAIGQLAAILLASEAQAVAERQATLLRRLPPATYDRLLGVEPHLQHLTGVLLAPGAPWIVSIEGLGGLGKTALTHQLIIRLAARPGGFADFGWVSIRQPAWTAVLGDRDRGEGDRADLTPAPGSDAAGGPALSVAGFAEQLARQLLGSMAPVGVAQALAALETRLHQAAHLVVIDNLETLADVAALAPVLARLAGPSKFVLTSRASQGPVALYRFPVPELSEADALALVRSEARQRNLPHVAAASDAELRPLFATVGGNPLALQIVTGQLHLLSLPQVIENLREAQGKKAEELYRFIYWKAWQQLPADAQDTLLLMPLFAGDGADLAAVQRVSDLPGPALIEALDYLARVCLVNVTGDLQARRFGIHRLTEAFLLREVLKWRQGEQARGEQARGEQARGEQARGEQAV